MPTNNPSDENQRTQHDHRSDDMNRNQTQRTRQHDDSSHGKSSPGNLGGDRDREKSRDTGKKGNESRSDS